MSSLLVFFLCAGIVPAHATVYQYFDEEGTLIVTDNPYGLRTRRNTAFVPAHRPNLSLREGIGYDYYPVAGKNFHEAVHGARLRGPQLTDDQKDFAAQTKWSLGWSYRFNSSYRIEQERVKVSLGIVDVEFASDILVTLPAATGEDGFSAEDMRQWNDFVQRLLDHEHDHVRIVQDRREWDAALERIRSLREIELPYAEGMNVDAEIRAAVEAETAKIGHELIRTIKVRNEKYDRVTMHGIRAELRDGFFREEGIPQ
ncbi:MAG: hypothetical protein OHK006_12110 [Thermodesulfovibrionales bacterium]